MGAEPCPARAPTGGLGPEPLTPPPAVVPLWVRAQPVSPHWVLQGTRCSGEGHYPWAGFPAPVWGTQCRNSRMGCHRPSGRCPGLHRPLDLQKRHGQRATDRTSGDRTSGARPCGTTAEQAHCRAGRVRVRRRPTDKEPRLHRDLSEWQFPHLRTGDDNRGGLRACTHLARGLMQGTCPVWPLLFL